MLKNVRKTGRKTTLKSDKKCIESSKNCLSEHASELGSKLDSFGSGKSFESIVNSSKIACSSASEKCSKMVPFWSRFGGQHRRRTVFSGGSKSNEKHSRSLVDLGCQSEVQNRSQIVHFLMFLLEPCFGGSWNRFLIDFGTIFDRCSVNLGVNF